MPTGNDQSSFGKWLRNLRGEKSLREFAGALGIDQSYLQRIESEERPPSEMLCIRVARATGEKLATVLEMAGFAEKGEFDDEITDDEHRVHRALEEFADPEEREAALDAALAVIRTLADAKSKKGKANPRRAPSRSAPAH